MTASDHPGSGRRWWLVLAGGTLLVLGGPASAAPTVDCEPGPAALEDIATLAEQQGIPMDEAIERYGWQEGFAEVASQLRTAHPESFAGAALLEEGAWIAFKDEVPEEATDLVEALPKPGGSHRTPRLLGSRAE
ncbi:MAG: hypothetical protein L0Z63_01770 [Actinobacteria bacterium]|nr:hypothetical protein [Actinomycetota bacterium]